MKISDILPRIKTINEAMESFVYTLPESKEQQIYDFYMASLMSTSGKDEVIEYIIRETKTNLFASLKKELLSAVYFSICAEIRHWVDKQSNVSRAKSYLNTNEMKMVAMYLKLFLPQLYSSGYGMPQSAKDLIKDLASRPRRYDSNHEEYYHSYRAALKSFPNKETFVTVARKMFDNSYWADTYGGPKWSAICTAWMNLYNAESLRDQMVWIDHVYDLQHNTGTVFNKLREYSNSGGYEWLKTTLDFKYASTHPYEIFEKCSSQMKRLAAYVLHMNFGTSYEQWRMEKAAKNKEPEPVKTKEPGPVNATSRAEKQDAEQKAKIKELQVIASSRKSLIGFFNNPGKWSLKNITNISWYMMFSMIEKLIEYEYITIYRGRWSNVKASDSSDEYLSPVAIACGYAGFGTKWIAKVANAMTRMYQLSLIHTILNKIEKHTGEYDWIQPVVLSGGAKYNVLECLVCCAQQGNIYEHAAKTFLLGLLKNGMPEDMKISGKHPIHFILNHLKKPLLFYDNEDNKKRIIQTLATLVKILYDKKGDEDKAAFSQQIEELSQEEGITKILGSKFSEFMNGPKIEDVDKIENSVVLFENLAVNTDYQEFGKDPVGYASKQITKITEHVYSGELPIDTEASVMDHRANVIGFMCGTWIFGKLATAQYITNMMKELFTPLADVIFEKADKSLFNSFCHKYDGKGNVPITQMFIGAITSGEESHLEYAKYAIEKMLKLGADPNGLSGINSETCIDIAVNSIYNGSYNQSTNTQKFKVGIIEMLINYGAEITEKTNKIIKDNPSIKDMIKDALKQYARKQMEYDAPY